MSLTKTPRSGVAPQAAQPAPPSRLYSFTGWQASNPTAPPPGDRMDADYDNTNTALTQTLSWAATSLNTDGTLKASSVGQSQLVSGLFDDIAQDIIAEVQPLVDQAQGFASAAGASSMTAQAAATAADHSNTAVTGTASAATAAANAAIAARDTAQTYATTAQTAATNASNADNHATGEAALAQDYADVTQAWAEHMPDTIPPNILAVMGVTGSHWSSRWWANQAGINARGGGAYVGAAPPGDTLAPLWWDNASGQLFIQYSDGNSTQWVSANSVTADQLTAAIGTQSVINVLDHGAKGNGTTDDTAAIQGVLDAYAGKATVFVPDNGQPYIVTPLLLPTGTDLLLHGTLKAPAAAGASTVDIVSASNVTIRGHGTIDGNGAAGTYPNPIASLYIYQSTYVQVSGITIKNALNFNIDALQSSHVRIDKVTLLGGVNSSGFAQGDDCWLTNSTIDGPSGDGGFAFYGAVTNSGAIGNTIKNSGIAGNIPSIGLYVLSDGGSPDPCGNIVMADNVVHNCGGQGIAVLRSTTGAYHDGVIIANNRCYNNGKVAYAPGGSSDLYVDNCHHITFTGNQSSGFGVAGTPTCHGLHVGVNVVGVTLTGNQISNVGQGRTDGIGIYVNSPTDLLASSNNVYDDQATPTTAISIAGTAGGNNQFIGNACQLAITVTLQADTVCANVISGQWTIGNGTGRGAAIELNGAPGQSSVIEYAVNDKARWFVGNNGTGESTGNAGSDYQIISMNDAGSGIIGTPLSINRATGQVTLASALVTGPLTIGTGTGTPTLTLNGAAGAGKGIDWQSVGTMRWRLETTAGEDLALNAYNAAGAWLGQAIQFTHDASSIVTNFPLIANASQAIPTQGVVGIQAIAKNTGSNIGNGYQFSYYSSAFANGFDVGFTRLAAFDPAPYVAGQTPIYQADWTLVCSPNDTTHNWACIVAEWDVVNRGADMGWKRDRGSANPTGGLLMVAEATAVLGGESGEGKNATFAYSVSHSGENNSTGFPAKFYNGYLIEPDSIVGGTGRGIYMTGDITSTASQRPYGPAQFEGTWLHGIDHTLAAYIDGHAEILAPGQAVAWLVGSTTAPTAAASITGSGSGTNASLTLTPAGTGTIALAGNSSVAGGLTVSNGVAVSAGLSTFSADALFQSSSFNAIRLSGLVSAYRLMSFETSGVVRFRMGLDPTVGEPGGNVGSPFVIAGYSDAGGGLGTYLSIARNNGALSLTNSIGVWGATPPATKPVMSGAKGGNTALASVIALLVAYGLGSDSTTA